MYVVDKIVPPDLEDQAGIGAVGKIDIGDIPPAAIDLYSQASGNTEQSRVPPSD